MVLSLGGFQRGRCGRSASWGAAGGPAGRPCVLHPFSLPGLVCLCIIRSPHHLPLRPTVPLPSPPGSVSPPAPRISLFLPSPRSSSPGSLHPPSPSYASFCPSDPSPSHLCLLLLRGGCDPRNISEGEEGVSRSRAERDRLGRRSERGSLLQPGRGAGLVHLSGPKFKSCLFLTSAG